MSTRRHPLIVVLLNGPALVRGDQFEQHTNANEFRPILNRPAENRRRCTMFEQNGRWIPLSPQRVMISDLMHFAKRVPGNSVQRRIHVAELVKARRNAELRPAWCLIFTKAFSLVAERTPQLRRAFLEFPWDHLYQHPVTIASLTVERELPDENEVAFVRFRDPSRFSLRAMDRRLRQVKHDPGKNLRMVVFSRWLASWLWRPIRRGLGWLGLNASGRFRAEQFGTMCVSSLSGMGAMSLHPLSPLPFFLNYGVIDSDGSVELQIVYDHRILDGAIIARALMEMELVLCGPILEELLEMAPSMRMQSPLIGASTH